MLANISDLVDIRRQLNWRWPCIPASLQICLCSWLFTICMQVDKILLAQLEALRLCLVVICCVSKLLISFFIFACVLDFSHLLSFSCLFAILWISACRSRKYYSHNWRHQGFVQLQFVVSLKFWFPFSCLLAFSHLLSFSCLFAILWTSACRSSKYCSRGENPQARAR